jgi:hypothetical protein
MIGVPGNKMVVMFDSKDNRQLPSLQASLE